MLRFSDFCLALLALTFLSPLLLAIMVALRFSGEGEVFYRQTRVGRGGREFGLWKFATMLKNSPNMGTGVLTLANDPRILPLGRFLRKTKLNEVPQLFNVLVGEMSLIGPRPQAPAHHALFPEQARERMARIRPGLSGIGAIIFRDEESLLATRADPERFYAEVISPYKAEVECWYVDHQTLRNYVLLLLLTLWVVLVPSSKAVWRLMPELPPPPAALGALLGTARSKEKETLPVSRQAKRWS